MDEPLAALVRVRQKASDVLGSDELGAQWLTSPAIAFGWRTPESIMETPEGVQQVLELLVRMEYCVYT